jgi:mannose-1-phosphate guanylyltransferase
VAAFVSADHHVPDQAAFVAALQQAARSALDYPIVTLGFRPDTPSTAFGYIRPLPDGRAVARVGAFIEKPDQSTAERYVAAGYLWNSGNFICKPEALLAELAVHAPEVAMYAKAAVASAREDVGATMLGPEFAQAPKTSIDRALMERTTQAAVLPVGFVWSDIGSWRAVFEAAAQDAALNSVVGDVLLKDCTGCLVRTPPGMRLAMIGVHSIAVVANADGDLLVCDLVATEDVRLAASRFPK